MWEFLKKLGQRLGGAAVSRTTTGQTAGGNVVSMPTGTPEKDAPSNTPDFITAQDYYRRDGQHDDGSQKWQLRQCLAVRIRDDMWQIREIHTALHAPPQDGTAQAATPEATGEQAAIADLQGDGGDVIANTITDMVDSLEDALARLQTFEDDMESEDWLPSAAQPAHPTRHEISAALAASSLAGAAE